MGLWSALLGLIACDPVAWEEERQRLQPENFDKIKAGMLEVEVLHILGKPHQTITYALKPLETYLNWRWRTTLNEGMIFSAVIAPSTAVIRTETWRNPNDPKNHS